MKIAQLQKTVKRYLRTLRLLDSLGILSKTGSETFRAILLYRKKKESHKKNICYRPKISAFHKGFDRGNTVFQILRNLVRKGCFQMLLEARQSSADAIQKLKTDGNRAKF